MPIFRVRNRVEILRQMVARIISRSALKKLRRNSIVYHIIAAAADSDADIYFRLSALRAVFSIDNATGSDLDERAREIQPGTIERRKQSYASSFVIFSRQDTTGSIPLPVGSLVGVSDGNGTISYRTTAASVIPDSEATSALVPIVATIAGTRANVDENTIRKMITRIPGVTGVTNPSAITNGINREKDPSFLGRLKDFIRSLPRGTVDAIEGFARQVRLSDGRRVLFSKLYEPIIPNGTIYLYIDDGTGSAATYDDSFVGGIGNEEVLKLSATGGETRFITSQRPVRDDIALIVRVNDVVITRNIDWAIDVSKGVIELLPSGGFPGGLTVGDKIALNYRFYTGLLQETQKVISGDPSNRLLYPGVAAAGIIVIVLAANPIFQTLETHLVTLPDFDFVETAATVKGVIQEYINTLDVGDDVIVSKIIEIAMQVAGVFNFKIFAISGASVVVDQVIASHQVARIQTSDIHIS